MFATPPSLQTKRVAFSGFDYVCPEAENVKSTATNPDLQLPQPTDHDETCAALLAGAQMPNCLSD